MSLKDPVASVVIGDPHPVTRLGLSYLLQKDPGFEVIGQAGELDVASERTVALQPTLLLSELRWPSGNGLEFLLDLLGLKVEASDC